MREPCSFDTEIKLTLIGCLCIVLFATGLLCYRYLDAKDEVVNLKIENHILRGNVPKDE